MDALLLFGIVIGLTISIVVGAFANTMAGWFSSVQAYNKPQKIELYTTETPAEIKRRADQASRAITFFHYTIALLFWLAIDYAFPVFALRVYDGIIDLLITVLLLLRDVVIIWLDTLRL